MLSEDVEKSLSDDAKKALKDLVDGLIRKDTSVRIAQLLEIKKNELFFAGFQRLYRDHNNSDWLIADTLSRGELARLKLNPEDLGRTIGITKAHCEALIAAISAAVPSVRYFPEDADDIDDLITAETYSKAGEVIQHQNNIKALFMYAIYTRLMQHYVAFYNYHEVDEKYGVYTIPKMGEKNFISREHRCVQCGELQAKEEGFEEDITPQENLLPSGMCPLCMTETGMAYPETSESRTVEIGFDIEAKSQERIEVYGPKFVHISSYAKKLSDTPYLILETDVHYAKLRELYPDHFEEISPNQAVNDFERWSRAPIQWSSSDEREYLTHRRCWLQPWAFNGIEDEALREALKSEYPHGIKLILINENVITGEDESLEEHWTIPESPTSSTICDAPLVRPIIEINEILNDLTTLTEETIRQAIPQAFADPNVLDFDAYRDSDAAPGNVFPAVPKAGQRISDAFFVANTAALSKEVAEFSNFLQQMAQFTMGSFPSVYGGPQQGDRTAAEYSQSRAQALQRLSIHWEALSGAFAQLMGKCTSSFFKNIKYDERYVLRRGNSFFNVFIERTKASGKVGKVLAEVSDQLPVTWIQKRQMLFQMLSMNKEPIDMTLFHPNNTQLMKSIVGVQDLFIPGEDDRNKQLSVVSQLATSEPAAPPQPPNPMDPMSQPTPGMPSIQPNPDVDDLNIAVQVCKSWAISEEGQFIQRTNPKGYANVMFYLQMCNSIVSQQAEAQMMKQLSMMGGPGGPGFNGPVKPPPQRGQLSPPKPPSNFGNPSVGE